ncbi:hypothetical protein CRYUN_Cryun15aG0043700 [Craigia yunnanensis]
MAASRKKLSSKKDDEFGDLQSWMHKNGLPLYKVVLKERLSYDEKLRPIHYVTTSEDLQRVPLARRFALVPLRPPLLAYRSNCKAMLNVVNGAVELLATIG